MSSVVEKNATLVLEGDLIRSKLACEKVVHGIGATHTFQFYRWERGERCNTKHTIDAKFNRLELRIIWLRQRWLIQPIDEVRREAKEQRKGDSDLEAAAIADGQAQTPVSIKQRREWKQAKGIENAVVFVEDSKS